MIKLGKMGDILGFSKMDTFWFISRCLFLSSFCFDVLQDGWTALIASCKEGYPDIVASLLDNGAKHNMADTVG